ncbi:hypothetical protein D041_3971A, partial [Vibrio parahaemolyticus EKP-008]
MSFKSPAILGVVV